MSYDNLYWSYQDGQKQVPVPVGDVHLNNGASNPHFASETPDFINEFPLLNPATSTFNPYQLFPGNSPGVFSGYTPNGTNGDLNMSSSGLRKEDLQHLEPSSLSSMQRNISPPHGRQELHQHQHHQYQQYQKDDDDIDIPQGAAGQFSLSSVKSPLDKSSVMDMTTNFHGTSAEAISPPEDSVKAKAKMKKQLVDEQDAILIAREDSELTEEELQLKKKAQNRAAQRAFRERKEFRLKDLETKLNKSEAEKQHLLDQIRFMKEKQLHLQVGGSGTSHTSSVTDYEVNFPKPLTDFINKYSQGHQLATGASPKKVYNSPDNPTEKLLGVGAVWDYLQLKTEELELDDYSLDAELVMEKLKGQERCHGYGPAYPLSSVDQAIRELLGCGI